MERLRNTALTTRWGRACKRPIQRFLARMGYELSPVQQSYQDFVRGLTRRQRIDLLVDVGANQGQYARRFRALGFTGRMISFEPMREAYDLLARAASSDAAWSPHRVALGERGGHGSLYVAGNSVSTSLLPIADLHVRSEPASRIVRREPVEISTLDEQLAGESPSSRVWLKLDVQGYEQRVLAGASRVLAQSHVVQCELSTQPLYDGQASYLDVLEQLGGAGFTPVHIIPGFADPSTGEMLQFDIIAARIGGDSDVG